jgi:uncharacterized protein (TIGR03437 family)
MGPGQLVVNQPVNGMLGTELSGTTVSFSGVLAPVLYTSEGQVSAIVPYKLAGAASAQIVVSYQGQTSAPFPVPVSSAAPAIFSANGTGAGQAAAVNPDGTLNDASHPAAAGSYISLYLTGTGQTTPPGVDGQLASTQPYPAPIAPISATVGGVAAQVLYEGAAPAEVAGVTQLVLQIPAGTPAGGYVPIQLTNASRPPSAGAIWISVSAN